MFENVNLRNFLLSENFKRPKIFKVKIFENRIWPMNIELNSVELCATSFLNAHKYVEKRSTQLNLHFNLTRPSVLGLNNTYILQHK